MKGTAILTSALLVLGLAGVGCEDKQHVYRESTRTRVIKEEPVVTPDEEGELEKTGESTTIIRTKGDKTEVYHESTQTKIIQEDEPIVTGD